MSSQRCPPVSAIRPRKRHASGSTSRKSSGSVVSLLIPASHAESPPPLSMTSIVRAISVGNTIASATATPTICAIKSFRDMTVKSRMRTRDRGPDSRPFASIRVIRGSVLD
jgi:hypothetical protein